MTWYQKKPVVVEAEFYDGSEEWIEAYDKKHPNTVWADYNHGVRFTGRMAIKTLDSIAYADPGDAVIIGIRGECYPCRRDIFEETYQEMIAIG